MKIIVFGATGSVGVHLVDQALAAGHDVTAFVRKRKGKLSGIDHSRLTFAEGDVLDMKSVENAIPGHDAVFCVLGAGRKGTIRSQGTKVIVDAMKLHGIRRLICQSTLGAGDSAPNLNFFWKYIMFGWFLKEAYMDHQLQEQYVRNSGLDWTIVRPAAFTDGPATGVFKHGFKPDEKHITLKISRADVAKFLLMQLESNQYLMKTPGLSY